MSLGGRLVSLFPALYLVLVAGTLGWIWLAPAWWSVLLLIAVVYLVPLACFRVHELFLPLGEGQWDLSEPAYNRWWASYCFQYPFTAVPWLEALIHFVPGLYSCWLRAWGSKIGKRVFWTPRVDILDRSLIEVGDGVVFGHLSAMSCHAVSDIDGRPMLITMKIKIGERSLIGVDSQFGPGVVIPPRTQVKPKTRRYWKGDWP